MSKTRLKLTERPSGVWYSRGVEHTEGQWWVGWRLGADGDSFGGGSMWIWKERDGASWWWRCRRFNYWAVALLPSPRPRILKTTPLLLHSRKEQTETPWRKRTFQPQRFQKKKRKKEGNVYFFKAHGTEFVYFACVFWTGNRSACVDVRPEPRRLFEHLWVLLVLWKTQQRSINYQDSFIL